MKIEPTFSNGDTAYIATITGVRVGTIGTVRVEVTESKGNGDPDEIFDNYKPQSKYVEQYMCEETGIGSGSKTREEAEAAILKAQSQK